MREVNKKGACENASVFVCMGEGSENLLRSGKRPGSPFTWLTAGFT